MKSVKAKKSLGQNFLKDETILKKIADLVTVTKDDLLLEIGPGMGALTKYLVLKDCPVLAYEIDLRMKPYLEKLANLEVIYQDFLTSDLANLKTANYHQLFVVANIPYYITTPIIDHLIKNVIPTKMVLLVQKEVALRFAAHPKSHDYGFFTVFLNHYFEIKIEGEVLAKCFEPVPNVDSAIVSFTKKANIEKIDIDRFEKFVKKAFRQKRKTLKNNLQDDYLVIASELKKMGFSDNVRAEELSYENFVHLFKILFKL